MDLNLDQLLVGRSYRFRATFTPAHLAGRTNCMSKVLWLERFLSSSIGSLVWLQKKDASGSIKPINRSLPHGFLGVSIALGIPLICPQFQLPFPVLSPSICTWFLLLLTPTTASQPVKSILVSLPKKIHTPPLGSSFLLSLFRSMDYSMIILYFIAYVHLKLSL